MITLQSDQFYEWRSLFKKDINIEKKMFTWFKVVKNHYEKKNDIFAFIIFKIFDFFEWQYRYLILYSKVDYIF